MAPLKRYTGFADLLDSMSAQRGGDVALVRESGGSVEEVTWRRFSSLVGARVRQLELSGMACEAVFCDGSLECAVEAIACAVAGVQSVLVAGDAAEAEAAARVRAGDADSAWPVSRSRGPVAAALREDPIERPGYGRILFFTSGTSGMAKPVATSDARLMASAWMGSSLLPLSSRDRVLNLLPLSHVFGFVCGLLWGLSCGAAVALGRGKRHLFDDAALFRPTVMPLVPALAGFLGAHDMLGDRLRMVLIGAAPCPDGTVSLLRQRGAEVHCGYGLTETSSGIALSLGDDVRAMTLCPDARARVSGGGEVLVRAPGCMMEGYYGIPSETAAAIQGGWLRTGDAGAIDGRGRLHVAGRIDDVITFPTGVKLCISEFESRIRELSGEGDVALAVTEGAPVLVCGAVSLSFDERAALQCADEVLRGMCGGSRVTCTRAMFLGRSLPRTAGGDVQHWRLNEEVARWRPRKK